MKANYSNLLPEISLKLKKGKIEKITICNSSDCANLFRKIWDKDSLPIYESFIVIFLDRQNKSIGWLKISQGGITGTVTDIRLIFSFIYLFMSIIVFIFDVLLINQINEL